MLGLRTKSWLGLDLSAMDVLKTLSDWRTAGYI